MEAKVRNNKVKVAETVFRNTPRPTDTYHTGKQKEMRVKHVELDWDIEDPTKPLDPVLQPGRQGETHTTKRPWEREKP